jgi:hypothetical protein
MRLNARMRRLIPEAWPRTWNLQPELEKIASRGFAREEDCVVFSGQHGNRSNFPDSTGYECFANHIHIDDLVSESSAEHLVEQALALAAFLNEALCKFSPDATFRFIIGANDDGCTLHFHAIRAREHWETEDLELYLEDAMAVIESDELLAASAPQ